MPPSLPRQACVLTGGLGTRLGALAEGKPKPMVDVGGRPFLDAVLDQLAGQGVIDIILIAAHLGEQVRARYDGKTHGAAKIRVVIETALGGTAGALKAAESLLDPVFFVTNGDSFFAIDLATLANFPIKDSWQARLALCRMEDAGRYGSVVLEDSRITRFAEKSATGPGLVNGGVYVLKREVMKRVVSLPASFERDVFPVLAAEGLLHGYVFDGSFIDIGTPADLVRARQKPFAGGC